MPTKGAMMPPMPKTSRLRRSNALAPIGLYFTPRNAKGMSSGMIMALKMTAARVELTTDLHGFTRIYCSAVCMLSRGSVHRRLPLHRRHQSR